MAEHEHHKEVIDAATGQTIRSHEWDGIKELNTPLPRWWINIFYATIVWSVGYWVVYPSWPLINSHLPGVIGYSSRADLQTDLDALKVQRGQQAAALVNASVEDIAKDPAMRNIAVAQGKAAFGDNCAPCHGLGGNGSRGYPNLIDDDWIWGGTLADIQKTIMHGIRVANSDETRMGVMSAFGRDGILKPDEVRAVANHVRGLAKLEIEPKAELAKGAKVFEEQCASCHGPDGKGMKEQGAPNLTDAIWLYGSRLEDILESVNNGRAGMMPAWSARLDPVTIKSLAVYVQSLGGGK